MALKLCRECGKEVSPMADRCPKCGAYHPGLGRFGYGVWKVLMLLVIVFAVFFGLWCYSCVDQVGKAASVAYEEMNR